MIVATKLPGRIPRAADGDDAEEEVLAGAEEETLDAELEGSAVVGFVAVGGKVLNQMARVSIDG
jgi:hypothetical protein